MTIDAKTGHDFHDETDHGGDREAAEACSCCNDGLAYCKTCGGAEGSLPTDCPGQSMNAFEDRAITAGVLDVREGQWVLGNNPDPAYAIRALVDAKTAKFLDLPEALKDAALAAIKYRPKEPEHAREDGTVRKDHYGSGCQPWDDIIDAGWAPAFAAGNVLKYVRRAAAKNGDDDLDKARWYWRELLKLPAHYKAGNPWSQRAVDAERAISGLRRALLPPEIELLEGAPR